MPDNHIVLAQSSDLARSRQFDVEKLGWKLETDEPAGAGVPVGKLRSQP